MPNFHQVSDDDGLWIHECEGDRVLYRHGPFDSVEDLNLYMESVEFSVDLVQNEDTPGGWLVVARRIVENKQAERVGILLLDLFSASIMVQIFDGVNKQNQERLLTMGVVDAHYVCCSVSNKLTSSGP